MDGKVQRKRSCNNPSPILGAPCQGEDQQEEDCGKCHSFSAAMSSSRSDNVTKSVFCIFFSWQYSKHLKPDI